MSLILALCVLANDDAALERARGVLGGVPALGAWATQENDYKALRETNIFSPWKPPKPEKKDPPPAKPPEKKDPPPPPQPDPILVTGFYYNEAEKRFEVVIEDKKKREIRWMKPGDQIDGWTILTVTAEKMTAKKNGGEREFRLGETVNGVAPPPRPLDEKEALGEASIDPAKLDEAKKRLRERGGKKAMVEDEEADPTVEKKKKN